MKCFILSLFQGCIKCPHPPWPLCKVFLLVCWEEYKVGKGETKGCPKKKILGNHSRKYGTIFNFFVITIIISFSDLLEKEIENPENLWKKIYLISIIQPGWAKFGKLVYFVDSRTNSHRTFDHHKWVKIRTKGSSFDIDHRFGWKFVCAIFSQY